MSRQNRRRDDEETYEEEVEDTDAEEDSAEGSSDETNSDAPRRSLRPAELMFSTTGRLALGVFGVLLLIGAAAALRPFLTKEKTPLSSAKKSAAKDSEKKDSTGGAPSTAAQVVNKNQERVTPPLARQTSAQQPLEDAEPANPLRNAKAGPDTAPAIRNSWEEDANTAESPAPATAEVPDAAENIETAPSDVTPTASAEPVALVRTGATATTPTRSYRTHAGESLFDIARYELEDAARWVEIYELNAPQLAALEDQLANLPANTTLKIPVQ